MGEVSLLALLFALSGQPGRTSPVWPEVVEPLVLASDVPGKFVKGQCAPFACELYRRLAEAGVDTHLIVYSWRIRSGEKGVHAMVVYRGAENRFWAMDNEKPRPVPLRGVTAMEWCQSFCPKATVAVRLDYSPPLRTSRKRGVNTTLPRQAKPRPVSESPWIAQLSQVSMGGPGHYGEGR